MRLVELMGASVASVALLLVVNCSALHMYPEIFDTKSQFLQARPALPAKGSDSAPSALADGPQFRSGSKDDEVGYVRSSSESGKGGYLHRENFHRKDGNKYGNEKQTGFGESKRADSDSNSAPKEGELKDAIIIDTDHHRPEPTYEVTEEQSDVENPDKDKKYGAARPIGSGGDKRKAPQMKKVKPVAKPKAGRSNQQNNHNGYESIVYHEKEHDSMEKGYGKRKASGKMPAKQIAYDYLGEVDDEQRLLDDGEGEGGRDDSDFGDNYDMVRFDADFERSYGDDEQEGEEKAAAGRSDGADQRQDGHHEDYDYDEEVDREQVDESASEDKYRGDDESGEESDDDGDERQYEYASEADGDAQDY